MNRGFALAALLSLSFAACSRQVTLTDPIARGQRNFVGLGCSQCHMIGDVGHEWGPNLTLVGFRKSPEWLDTWLKNPHTWNARTVMPNFNLSEGARKDLVAYLSAQKGGAWAVYPWRTPEAKALTSIQRGELIFNKAGCVACHGQFGHGGYPNNNVAGGVIPTLTLVSEGYTKAELHTKIHNGQVSIPADASAPKPMLFMPKWSEQLTPAEIDAVVEYLFTLKPKPTAGSPASKDDF